MSTLLTVALVATSPVYYYSLAEQAGQMHGLPPGLMAAIVRAESAGNPSAISRAGAIGLAQLMPATAKQMGVDPWNSWENVYGGAKYLAQLLHRFGRLDFAIAAYNAGPGRVHSYAGIPPFRETQTYVKRVLRYYDKSNRHTRPTLTTSSIISSKNTLPKKIKPPLTQPLQPVKSPPKKRAVPQLKIITASIDDLDKTAPEIKTPEHKE